jgi:hypothetical protein
MKNLEKLLALEDLAWHVRHLRVLGDIGSLDDTQSKNLAEVLSVVSGALTGFAIDNVVMQPATLAILAFCGRLTNLEISLPAWYSLQHFHVFPRLTVLTITAPSWAALRRPRALPALVTLELDTTSYHPLNSAPRLSPSPVSPLSSGGTSAP